MLLWSAIRKSGLTQEQIDRKSWAITLDDLFDKLEWRRIDEVNEVLALFFVPVKKTEATPLEPAMQI